MSHAGPYRVGSHSPINVWRGASHTARDEQVCMATSPDWAQRIAAALNASARPGTTPRFIDDDQGDRTLIDAGSGVRMLTQDQPGMWSTHLIGSSWAGWVAFAKLILAADYLADSP
jgi:hypothetical protein